MTATRWFSLSTLAVSLLACSSDPDVDSSSGGATAAGGSSAASGGSTGPSTNGGSSSSNGGNTMGAGGSSTSTSGGAMAAGGSAEGGRGPTPGTGGTTSTSGGANGNGGRAQAGSTGTTGGAGSGGSSNASGGSSAGAGSCVPASCGSHKWACWKMPNPTGSGLPNPASYTTNGDVVHDNVTCLDWEKSPPSTTASNTAAIARCEALTLGGFDDWRAPTRVEMSSILDWTRSPATDAAFTSAGGFHKTGSNWVLTIDQRGAGAGKDLSWAFNMSDGIVSNARSAATADRIRCVRGNGSGEGFSDKAVTPPNQYTAVSADEAQDNYTGLIWQRDGNASGALGWDQAVTYCAGLSLGGHDDWRLPSVRELATLVDENLVAPSINRTMFSNTHYGARSENWYWASHRQRGSSTASWGLNFDDGFTGFNAGASGAWNYWTTGYAKCVR